MMNKKILSMLSVVLVLGAFWIVFAQEGLTPQEQLGKNLDSSGFLMGTRIKI